MLLKARCNLFYTSTINFLGGLHFFGCLPFLAHLHFWVRIHFWGHLHFWGYLHTFFVWGCLYFCVRLSLFLCKVIFICEWGHLYFCVRYSSNMFCCHIFLCCVIIKSFIWPVIIQGPVPIIAMSHWAWKSDNFSTQFQLILNLCHIAKITCFLFSVSKICQCWQVQRKQAGVRLSKSAKDFFWHGY